MAVRLRSYANPHNTLGLTTSTWRELLRLALSYGWQPMGSVSSEDVATDLLLAGFSNRELDDERFSIERNPARWLPQVLLDTYFPNSPERPGGPASGRRLVLLEDALNLVDALDRGYQNYEPLRLPASYFLFEPDDPALNLRPSLGALAAAIAVCRQGSFSIEPWR